MLSSTKLTHPTTSIRQRHLTSLHSKLFHTKTISLSSLLSEAFIQNLLQYFTFEEVPSTSQALEICLKIASNDQGARILLHLGAMILFQQLRILLPTERLRQMAADICMEMAKLRVDEELLAKDAATHGDETFGGMQSMGDGAPASANVSTIIAPSESNIDDASSIHSDNSAAPPAAQSLLHRQKLPQTHLQFSPAPLLSDHDEAFLFQLNVKLRHINSDIVLDALNVLKDFLLRDMNIRVLLRRNMDVLKSLLVLVNATLPAQDSDPTAPVNPSAPPQPPNPKSTSHLDLIAIECLDIFVEELYKLNALERDIAIETFHLVMTHSISALRKLECAPQIISCTRRLLPFVESNANDPALTDCWLSCLDSMSQCLHYYHEHQLLFSDYIVIHIVDLFVKLLSKFPGILIENSTPPPLKRALTLFVQQPHIFFMYPELHTAIGELMRSIDTVVAKDIEHTNRTIQSLQQKDIMMRSASILEEHDMHDLSAELISKALDEIELVLPGQIFDPSVLVIHRMLHELFLLSELTEQDEHLTQRCKFILGEILSHPSHVVRSAAYTFLCDDMEAFYTRFLTTDILVCICLDTLHDSTSSEEEPLYDAASQLMIAFIKRIDIGNQEFHDMFRAIIPLLQCSIQDNKRFSSDLSGIVNMLSDQFSDESVTLQVYFRFLFHQQAWIREMAAKQLSRRLKYATSYEDPFAKFFDDDTFHEYEDMFEPKSLQSFDVDGAKNVLRLMTSPSMDVRISTEIASQVVELIKVKRFRHLFTTRDFFQFLLSAIEDDRTAYVGFVEKCLLALRVLLHFEPRFRDDIRRDEKLLKKLGRNVFHTDLEIRLITCKMITHLVFSPEMFLYNTDKFSYTWRQCSDEVRKEYVPNSKYLPFLAVPDFLSRSFYVSRTAATYNISVKHTIHYPPKSSEAFIKRLRHLQEQNINQVVRGLAPSSAFTTTADIAFLKSCRNVDLYCIVKSRMHAIGSDITTMHDHLSYLNTVWFIDSQATSKWIWDSDWRTAFCDTLENIPTSTADDFSLQLISVTLERIFFDNLVDKDDAEYFVSVFDSNLLDQLIIVPSYLDELPEQYVHDFSANVLDRRALKRALMKFLLKLVEVLVSDSRVQQPSVLWMNKVTRMMAQYLDTRIFQHKHIYLQKSASQILSLLTVSTTWTQVAQSNDLDTLLSTYRQACQLALLQLQSSSVIGFQLCNFLIVFVSNVGSIMCEHQLSWINDDGISMCRLLLDDVSLSRQAFALHILGLALVNYDDCLMVFTPTQILPQAVTKACANMLNPKADITIREQSAVLVCSVIRILVREKESILGADGDSLLSRLGCTKSDASLSPLMQFLLQHNLHIKLPQLLREERASKCFEEILLIMLQYVSIDSSELHSLLQDKYVIPFFIRFLNRDPIVDDGKPSLHVHDRILAQEQGKKMCIKLLHMIFSQIIIEKNANFEEHFSTSSYMQMFLEVLQQSLASTLHIGTRMAAVRLFGLLLDGSYSHLTTKFDRILASKTFTEDICEQLVNVYTELYQGNKYFSPDEKLIDSCMVISGCLSLFLGMREKAAEKAIGMGFMKTVVGVLENLVSSIQVEQFSRNVSSPKMYTYKFYLYSNLRLLRSFAMGTLEAKTRAIASNIMPTIKSLWMFSVQTTDMDLKFELLALILNLISSCPEGMREFVADVNPSKKGTNKSSMLERILKFTSKARPLKQAPFRLTYLCFRILSCLAIGSETRTILIKYNVIEDYMHLLYEHLKTKDQKRVELVLHFLVAFSTSKEGQNHIMKTKGLIDLITGCYELNHVRVRSHALLLMRNLMFQKQNKSHFLQDARTIEFLVDVLLNSESAFGVELKATAASALWCLVHNNQKAKFMAKKLPSLQKRLQELMDKLCVEYASLYNVEWDNDTTMPPQVHQKTEQYLMFVCLRNLSLIISTLSEKHKTGDGADSSGIL